MARRRRNPLLLAALAILFLGAGTAATLLLRPGGPLADPPAGDPTDRAAVRTLRVDPASRLLLRPAELSVRVLRDPGGVPVAGARVTVSGVGPEGTATTGADGRAEVRNLVEGSAAVRAEADGLDGPPVFTTLLPGDNGPVEIRLAAANPVAGRVVADEDGTPVAGATVTLRRDDDHAVGDARFGMVGGRAAPSTTTAADGTFSFPAGGAGARVVATAPEYVPGAAPAVGASTVEIRLQRGSRIRGAVRLEDGSPVAGVRVSVVSSSMAVVSGESQDEEVDFLLGKGRFVVTRRTPGPSTTSDPDGNYLLGGIPRRAIAVLTAQGNGFLQPGGPVEVAVPADGSDAVVDLVVVATGTLHVRWTGPDAGGGWYARVVRLPKTPGPEWSQSTNGNPPRGFVFGRMPPGRYEVTLSCPAGTGEAEVVVLPGATTEVEIGPMLPGDPREGPVLAGEVVDAAGVPVAGARVAVLVAGEAEAEFRNASMTRISSFTSDGAGRFRIRVTEPGNCWVRATASGFAPGAAGPFTPTTEGIRVPLSETGAVEGRLLVPPGMGSPRELVLGFLFAPEPGAAAAAVAGEPEHRCTTGFRDGSFLLKGLPAGRGTLVGAVDGIPFGPVEVVVPAGEVVDIGTLEVSAPRRVRGRVKDGAGGPLAGAFVRVEGNLPGLPSASSAADGSFLLEGVSPGEVRIRATRPPAPIPRGGVSGVPGRIVALGMTRRRNLDIFVLVPVPAGGDADAGDIVLPGPGEVAGRAFDAAGRPAAGARIGTKDGDFALAGAAGEFSLWLPAGDHELLLRLPGAAEPAARATVAVPPGGTVKVELRAAR